MKTNIQLDRKNRVVSYTDEQGDWWSLYFEDLKK